MLFGAILSFIITCADVFAGFMFILVLFALIGLREIVKKEDI